MLHESGLEVRSSAVAISCLLRDRSLVLNLPDSHHSPGDPSLKSGNGIPSRCVYLEEMAVDLEDQDWLDMNNVEQVPCPCSPGVLSANQLTSELCPPLSNHDLAHRHLPHCLWCSSSGIFLSPMATCPNLPILYGPVKMPF